MPRISLGDLNQSRCALPHDALNPGCVFSHEFSRDAVHFCNANGVSVARLILLIAVPTDAARDAKLCRVKLAIGELRCETGKRERQRVRLNPVVMLALAHFQT